MTAKVKVCQISTAHPTFDGRIFHKQCKSLVKAGFDVTLIVGHDKTETVDGVNIIPISKSKSRFKRFFFKSIHAFFKAKKVKADVYHLHDPELLITGILLKLFRKKVIFDMHELIYHQISDKDYLGGSLNRKLFAKGYKILESIGINNFNSIILAEDGYTKYFEKHYPKKMSKITIVRNYPILELINDEIQQVKLVKDDSCFKLVYAGSLSKIRGIGEICQAVHELDLPIQLILMGIWSDESLRTACKIDNHKIIYKGVLPLNEVYREMYTCDLGIALLYPVENHLTSLPVKNFEYMTCGIPMLISNFDSWQKAFKDVAIFSDPLNVNEIKEKIIWAMHHKNELLKMGNAGKENVSKNYSWENEAVTLVQVYKNLIQKNVN